MSLPLHFINLDRVPERADFMHAQCAAAGFASVTRFSAIDVKRMRPCARYRPERWGEYWSLLPSEVAVFESHRAIWEKIAASERPGVVMEDDVLISRHAGRICEMLAARHEQFDMVKLDGLSLPLRLGPATQVGEAEIRPLRSVVVPSAAAYLLSPAGARLLLHWSEQYCDHLDDFITRQRRGYRAYQLLPAVAVQAMFAELSGVEHLPPSVAGSERTSNAPGGRAPKGPLIYRLFKQARRTWRKLKLATGADRRLVARGGFVGEVPLAQDLSGYRENVFTRPRGEERKVALSSAAKS